MRSAESDDINENINLSLGDLICARTENVDRTRTHAKFLDDYMSIHYYYY